MLQDGGAGEQEAQFGGEAGGRDGEGGEDEFLHLHHLQQVNMDPHVQLQQGHRLPGLGTEDNQVVRGVKEGRWITLPIEVYTKTSESTGEREPENLCVRDVSS